MLEKLFKTYNEGQYKLKPWLANLIMGVLDFIFVVGWFILSMYIIFSQMMDTTIGSVFEDMVDMLEFAGGYSGLLIAGLFLIWNLLVWFIGPLRTKMNCKESLWNVILIIWSVVDSISFLSEM